MIDTEIKIHLSNGNILTEKASYKALLFNINDIDNEYLVSNNYMIPKINIEYIETKKIEKEIEEI